MWWPDRPGGLIFQIVLVYFIVGNNFESIGGTMWLSNRKVLVFIIS